MKNKRLVSILSVLLISVFSPSVFSQDTVVRIEPSSVTSPNVADRFFVDIVIENGQNVAGCQIWFAYDPSVLKYVGDQEDSGWNFEKGDYFPENAFYGERKLEELSPIQTRLRFAVTSSPLQNSGDGIIAILPFKVLAVKNSSLHLVIGDPDSGTGTLLSDVAGNLSAPDVKSAKVTPAPSRVRTDFALKSPPSVPVRCVAYSPDGTILAAGDNNNKVHLWKASTGAHLRPLNMGLGNTPDVRGIAFSPKSEDDGSYWFAAGSTNGTLNLWRREPGAATWLETGSDTWEEVTDTIEVPKATWKDVSGATNDISSVAFSHDGTRLAIGTSREQVFVSEYNNNTGKWDKWDDDLTLKDPTLKDKGHTENVRSVAFHPTNKNILATGADDNRVKVWDLSQDKNTVSNPQTLKDNDSGDKAFYRDGEVTSIAFSPDGTFLVSGSTKGNNKLSLWEVGSDKKWKHKRDFESEEHKHNGSVLCVAFNPSGTVLLSSDNNSEIHAWDVHEGEHQALIADHDFFALIDDRVYSPPIRQIDSIAFNPEGNAIAIGGRAPGGDASSGRMYQFTCTDQGDFSLASGNINSKELELLICKDLTDIASLNIEDRVGLDIRSLNIISEVAHSANKTYFVLDPFFARVTGLSKDEREKVRGGNCTITLDTSGLSYVMFPLEPEVDGEIHDFLRGAFTITLAVGGLVKGLAEKAGKAWSKFWDVLDTTLAFISIGEATTDIIDAVDQEDPPDFEITIETSSVSKDLLIGLGKYIGSYFFHIEPHQVYPYRILFAINGRLPSIGIKIAQSYSIDSSDYTVTYEGTWYLENGTPGAPPAQPMSLADYPPFQQLPPKVQAYILQHFEGHANHKAINPEVWQVPEETSLLPNYPNPFNPETWIPYQLSKPADVKLTIYDINGRIVRDLDLGHQRAGIYQSRARAAHWDGRNTQGEPVASGLYFYTLKAGEFSATRKMLIRK